ncbi:MAG: hypothetical protein LPJ89_02985, partial [Hymenobacteraceae bacterium]|nr:hypothetical protein [Hymenobacteraceae bacterium]
TAIKAQEKQNSLKVHFIGDFTPAAHYNTFSFDNFGICYERFLNRKFGVGVKYSFWLSAENAEKLNGVGYNSISENRYTEKGSLLRDEYRFLDVFASYRYSISSKHVIGVKAGPSVAYGTNTYTKRVYPYGNFEFPDCIIYVEQERSRQAYVGGAAEISYDYQFWHNRLSVGADAGSRFYNKGFPLQFNYGLHAGFNF